MLEGIKTFIRSIIEIIFGTESTTKEQKEEYKQAKYEYYRWVMLFVTLGSIGLCFLFWIYDCYDLGRISTETILSRYFPFLLVIPYIYCDMKFKNHKISVPFAYILMHCLVASLMWSHYCLQNNQFANELFMMTQIIFLALGVCAPLKEASFWHIIFMLDVIIAQQFNHYDNFGLIMIFAVAICIGSGAFHVCIEKAFIDQHKANQKVEHLMTHDALTDAYNRNQVTKLCVPDTRRFKTRDVGIILMDVDFFKKINDTYGHGIGDEVLKSLVKIIKSCVRSSDFVIRWGGEEFIVLLPNCELEEVKMIAERIRATVEAYDQQICRFTVSVGVAKYNGVDYTISINDADKALYYAKEHGRNQTILYEEDVFHKIK